MSSQLSAVLDQSEQRFVKIAPAHINYETEKGFAVQLLQNNSYLRSVAESNPKSLGHAIANVAAIGLSLNPAEKQAYLITRKVKVAQNKWEQRVFLEPSYMGLLKLATDSGSIEWIRADIVHHEDDFIDNGPGERPTHKYNAFSKDRGDIVGAYVCAKTKEGDYLTTVMDIGDINKVRDRSEAWKRNQSGPWKTDYKEMAKKSVIRNAFKTWPRTNTHMVNAVHLSNENEGFEPIETEPELKDFTIEQKEYFDQLISNSDALGMMVFSSTIDETVMTNLYHSFPKGQKGKYQSIVESLISTGRDQFNLYLDELIHCLESGDTVAIQESMEGLSADTLELMTGKLDAEHAHMLNQAKQEIE